MKAVKAELRHFVREEGVDTVVNNLQETGEAVDFNTGAIEETEELNETVINVVSVVLGEEATAVLGDALLSDHSGSCPELFPLGSHGEIKTHDSLYVRVAVPEKRSSCSDSV